MASGIDRRAFLNTLGVTMGAAALGVGLHELPVAAPAAAQDATKGRIPEAPVKFGHITILSGPGAILGSPSLKGHTLAAEEINAAGGCSASAGSRRSSPTRRRGVSASEPVLREPRVRAAFPQANEYPSYTAEAAYTGLYLFKAAVEKGNQAIGGWPDDEVISKHLEGLALAAPSGHVRVRPEDHRAFKDVKIGFSKNLPDYPFPVWDRDRVITIPVDAMTAPPTWPKPGQGHSDPSAIVNWIKTTWKQVGV